jgi:U6 snRNA-associated Sm-like protein LSm2
VGKEITVELKNDLAITGILHSVDQYLNIKLKDISISDSEKYPYMVRMEERADEVERRGERSRG